MELASNNENKRISEIEQAPEQPKNDFSKIIDQSAENLKKEKPKRHRRTKAELEADKLNPSAQPARTSLATMPQGLQTPIDRTKELKPFFQMYSELLFASPMECPDLKLSDSESQALAEVTNNLMNAFPEYFNNHDPKVMAIGGLVAVAAPIGYMKYQIYKEVKLKRNKVVQPQVTTEVKKEVKQPEIKVESFFNN